jgi:hypothetical protein
MRVGRNELFWKLAMFLLHILSKPGENDILIDIPVVFATTEIWILGIVQHYILYTRFYNFEELNQKISEIIV